MDSIGAICGMTDPPVVSRMCWVKLIAKHPNLALQAPHAGINPFTREPITLKPKSDEANVVVDGKTVGVMLWGNGEVDVSGEIEAAGPIAREIANALGGRFESSVESTSNAVSQGLSPEDLAEIAARRAQEIPGRPPLREYRVHLERVRDGDRAVATKYPENLGMRTKLGGHLDWIHSAATPKCKQCGASTTFVAQIDSIEHQSKTNLNMKEPPASVDYMFGDVGMIYVFFCFNCLCPETVTEFY